MRDGIPDERIIDRAVEIWKGLLRDPRHDNGDSSFAGGMAMALASMLTNDVDEERLEKFGAALKSGLMAASPSGYFNPYTGVDYGPDSRLAAAAQNAGISPNWPWKTTVRIEADHVYVRAGYSAPGEYHYLQPDGRWLVTDKPPAAVEG